MDELIRIIEAYEPANLQEEADKPVFLRLLREQGEAALSREACGQMHVTVSAWVLNPQRSKTLFCYHRIYDSWSWLGGHADGCADLAAVALKEASEESGIPRSELALCNAGLPMSLELLPVSGHVRKGLWVSSHVHANVTYMLEASEEAPLRICEDENSAVAWFGFEDALAASSEPWFVQRIYPKLIEASRRYQPQPLLYPL